MRTKLSLQFSMINDSNETVVVSTMDYGVYESCIAASRAFRSIDKMFGDKFHCTPSGDALIMSAIFEPVPELAHPKSPNLESNAPF